MCTNGAAGNVACPKHQSGLHRSGEARRVLPFQLAGTVVPNSGVLTNGMKAGGKNNDGVYYQYQNKLFWGPRVGMAWDVKGDHKQAIRAAAGLFYDFPRGGNSRYTGVPPVSFNQVVQNVTMDELASFESGGALTFTQNVVPGPSRRSTAIRTHCRRPIKSTSPTSGTSVSAPTAEVAYVGNFTRNSLRALQHGRVAAVRLREPEQPVQPGGVEPELSVHEVPGMGNITDFTEDQETLRYHSMQVSVQRRYRDGLQMGLAYTLSKGMGMQGWDPYTADPNQTINMGGTMVQGGEDALQGAVLGTHRRGSPSQPDRQLQLPDSDGHEGQPDRERAAQRLADRGGDEDPERHGAQPVVREHRHARALPTASRVTPTASRRAATSPENRSTPARWWTWTRPILI